MLAAPPRAPNEGSFGKYSSLEAARAAPMSMRLEPWLDTSEDLHTSTLRGTITLTTLHLDRLGHERSTARDCQCPCTLSATLLW